jgi:hypothetical protein
MYGLLMVLYFPLNRYFQYVHLQQQQDFLVTWQLHLYVRKEIMRLDLSTRILSGKTNYIDSLVAYVIVLYWLCVTAMTLSQSSRLSITFLLI